MAARDPVSTVRMILRPVGPDDFDDLLVLGRDPEVAFWTGPWTPADVESWVDTMIARWDTDQAGKWIARARVDGSLVGRGGFTKIDLNGESVLELGWAIRDHLTGRGLATELGRAALAWVHDHHHELPVVAFTEVHNGASRAVMERLGMRFSEVIFRDGLIEGRTGVQADAPFALYRMPPASFSVRP